MSGSSNIWRTFGVFCGDFRRGLKCFLRVCEGLTETFGSIKPS